ncbi:TRAP transporter substrate-binding protein [Pararhodobacter sp.]|uniref:TRAP transporter substrate-binding protein n=1 Tax=Pararhodobacter sp. TaxID=2127056 RepID=UPI002AFF4371|nr:TRAP transporter substrate-binding protein [Pararhodobacter sp.]
MNFSRSITGAAVAVALATIPAAAETLRLSHTLPEETVTGRLFNSFAERVNELTDGDLRIRVFHGGQLGAQRETMELVAQGALDIAKTNAAEMEAFDPIYSIFNLPYIFSSVEHMSRVLQGEVGDAVLASEGAPGMVGLGLIYEGCRSFYTVEPAASLADLAGLRIRVQPSPSAIRMIELMGAQPTPIAFPELYSALQQGVVDGAENNVVALTAIRHGEVARYYMRNEHSCIPAVYAISADTWEGLSEENRAALRTAASETLALSFVMQVEDEDVQSRIFTEDMGGTIVDVDKAPFQAAVAPMIDEAIAQGGQAAELIRQIQALAD